MWSDLLAENTSRAAALRTDCSRRNNVPDTMFCALHQSTDTCYTAHNVTKIKRNVSPPVYHMLFPRNTPLISH